MDEYVYVKQDPVTGAIFETLNRMEAGFLLWFYLLKSYV